MNVKNAVTYALAGLLALVPLAGCAGQPNAAQPAQEEKVEQSVEETTEQKAEQKTAASTETLAGGWTANSEATVALSDEESQIFQKAAAAYTGTALEPVTVLATQVVAGTNYAYLCRESSGSEATATKWAIAVVYNDLEGNAQITHVDSIELANVKTVNDSQGTTKMMGAWAVRDPSDAAFVPAEANEAFAKASEGYVGVALTPIALLGTQVVAGTNYLVLCQGAPVAQDAEQTLYLARVYADLNGNATFSEVVPFDLLAYV